MLRVKSWSRALGLVHLAVSDSETAGKAIYVVRSVDRKFDRRCSSLPELRLSRDSKVRG
jgi:hypothetical protein